MRILITNDDGITAPGLSVLERIATELAGPEGEVWTVAPTFEQSGVAHAISYTRPMMLTRLGPRRFSVDGSPADCVLAALHHILEDTPPDLVLSGVNRGNNSGENVLYSGTLGAALEGALQGILSIAASQYLGPRTALLDDPFEASAAHLGALLARIVDRHAHDGDDDYGVFYNINVPPVPADEVRGVRVVAQGRRRGTVFGAEPFRSPNGRNYLWIRGGDQHVPAPPDTDVGANLDGYISVTPMRANLTARDLIEHLREIE